MPHVSVATAGFLKEVLGGRVVLSVPDGTSVEGLMRHLAERHPDFAVFAYRDGALTDAFQIVVGERLLELAGGLGRLLVEGDEIVLLPPFEGGVV